MIHECHPFASLFHDGGMLHFAAEYGWLPIDAFKSMPPQRSSFSSPLRLIQFHLFDDVASSHSITTSPDCSAITIPSQYKVPAAAAMSFLQILPSVPNRGGVQSDRAFEVQAAVPKFQ